MTTKSICRRTLSPCSLMRITRVKSAALLFTGAQRNRLSSSISRNIIIYRVNRNYRISSYSIDLQGCSGFHHGDTEDTENGPNQISRDSHRMLCGPQKPSALPRGALRIPLALSIRILLAEPGKSPSLAIWSARPSDQRIVHSG